LVIEQHLKNLIVWQVKKSEHMRQTGIASALISAEKKYTGRQQIDRRLRKKLITATRSIALFQGLHQCFCRFPCISKRVQIGAFKGIHPSALGRIVEIDYMEAVVPATAALPGSQIMIVSDLAQIRVFYIVQAKCKRF